MSTPLKLTVLNPDEEPLKTMAILDRHASQNRFESEHLISINVADCNIFQRGKYIVIEYNQEVYYSEHIGTYCYIANAIDLIKPAIRKEWKNLARLLKLRQALRENTAQAMGLDHILAEGLTLHTYNLFVSNARALDHHPTTYF